VKTSILLFDNELAKQESQIAFVKISADGFDLGSSKRVVSRNDLPEALAVLQSWSSGNILESETTIFVEKTDLAVNGDYNLSGDRYKTNLNLRSSGWPLVPLGELVDILNGFAFKSELYAEKGTRIIRITNVQKGFVKDDEPKYYPESLNSEISKYFLKENDLLVSLTGNVGRVALLPNSFLPAALNQRVACLRLNGKSPLLEKYLYHLLNLDNFEEECINASSGVAQKNLSTEWLKTFEIPLPPLDVQEQIVTELDSYAAIISGAKQIIENWKPKIEINPEWETRELGDVCEVYQPKTITGAEILEDGPYKVYGANGVIGFYDKFNHSEAEVAITCRGATCGTVNFTEPESWITGNAMVVSPKDQTISKKFLQYLLIGTDLNSVITGSAQPQITGASLKPFEIHVPPIDVQEMIIELIDKEASLVNSAKQLIELYERRTKFVIEKLWSSVEESQ
jgi:restriction endonuclease S subunit